MKINEVCGESPVDVDDWKFGNKKQRLNTKLTIATLAEKLADNQTNEWIRLNTVAVNKQTELKAVYIYVYINNMYHLLCWYMHLSLHIANITTSLMSFTSQPVLFGKKAGSFTQKRRPLDLQQVSTSCRWPIYAPQIGCHSEAFFLLTW